VHWIASAVGIGIYSTSLFIIFQGIFGKSLDQYSRYNRLTNFPSAYVPMSYPQYAASLFAGNDFCRSLFAFGAVLFARPMYINLGIGEGISVLGGLSVLGIVSEVLRAATEGVLTWNRLECI
jgi:DHA1 family multidrug resistance protein-like MFS transporter